MKSQYMKLKYYFTVMRLIHLNIFLVNYWAKIYFPMIWFTVQKKHWKGIYLDLLHVQYLVISSG